MGMRFRKSLNLGPLRFTMSKSGISTSVGVKGFRVTKTASGRVRTTASIPGTGISYVKDMSGKKPAEKSQDLAKTSQQPTKLSPEPEKTAPPSRRAWLVPVIGIAVLLFCILSSAARQRAEQAPGRILNARDFPTQTAAPTATPRKVTAVQLPTPSPAPTVEILPLGAADVADMDVGDKFAEAEPTPTPTPEADHRYVLNTSSKKFHKPGCSSVGKMSEKNKREVIGPRSELIAEGYSPCGVCNP